MGNIVVSAPLDIQKRCLQIASDKTPKELDDLLGSLRGQVDKIGPGSIKAHQHLKCYEAYKSGWRGNYADREDPIQSEPDEVYSEEVEGFENEEPVASSMPPTDTMVACKFLRLKASAKRRNKEFDMTLKEVRRLLTIKRCQLTGVEMTSSAPGEEKPTDRTIDRLDSSQGYVVGNVLAVSRQANSMKNHLFEEQASKVFTSIDYLESLIKGIKKQQGK